MTVGMRERWEEPYKVPTIEFNFFREILDIQSFAGGDQRRGFSGHGFCHQSQERKVHVIAITVFSRLQFEVQLLSFCSLCLFVDLIALIRESSPSERSFGG